MSKYNTVIWDMDGTLLDTLDDLADGVNEAMTKFCMPLRTRDEIRSFIGNGARKLLELSVPGGTQNPLYGDALNFFLGFYAENCRKKTKPFDGLEKLLPELNEHAFKMAIVSNKTDSEVKALARLYFKDTLHVAIGDADGVRRKPYPDTVFKALSQLDAQSASTVYIGDTEVDIATAKNAGLDCISVSWGYRSREELTAAGATVIAATPDELGKLLLS